MSIINHSTVSNQSIINKFMKITYTIFLLLMKNCPFTPCVFWVKTGVLFNGHIVFLCEIFKHKKYDRVEKYRTIMFRNKDTEVLQMIKPEPSRMKRRSILL